MSLKYALLGQLKKRDMTGYELNKFIEPSISHFWSTDHTQIYRLLNQLEKQGFIQSEEEQQDSRPNRKRYHITNTGDDALVKWLHSTQSPMKYKDPFLIQIFFGESIDKETLITIMQHKLEAHESKLQSYDEADGIIASTAQNPQEELLERMTLDFGVRMENMYIEWLKDSIAKLKNED